MRRDLRDSRSKVREDEMGSNFNSDFCCILKTLPLLQMFVCYIRNKNCHFHNDACSKLTLNMTH